MSVKKVLTVYGYKNGKKTHRVFRIMDKSQITVKIPHIKSKKKTQKLILFEVLKQKGIKRSHVKKEDTELSLKNLRTLELPSPFRKPSIKKIIAEIFIVNENNVVIRSKNFRGKIQRSLQNEIGKYVVGHKLIEKKNMSTTGLVINRGLVFIKKLKIGEEKLLNDIRDSIMMDALVNNLVIEGYSICPIEVEIEKREIRLR